MTKYLITSSLIHTPTTFKENDKEAKEMFIN